MKSNLETNTYLSNFLIVKKESWRVICLKTKFMTLVVQTPKFGVSLFFFFNFILLQIMEIRNFFQIKSNSDKKKWRKLSMEETDQLRRTIKEYKRKSDGEPEQEASGSQGHSAPVVGEQDRWYTEAVQ